MPNDHEQQPITMTGRRVAPSQPWLTEAPAAGALESMGDGMESLGSDELLAEGFELRVGDRPFARGFRDLYKLKKVTAPAELASLRGDLWLVTHAFGVAARRASDRVVAVRYTARMEGAGAVVDLLPSTRFEKLVGADMGFEVGVGADGHARVPTEAVDVLGEVLPVGGGAELRLGSDVNVVGRLRFQVMSPKVQAIGVASSSATWQFDKDDRPLVGDQVLVETVLVPRGTRKLTWRVRATAVVSARGVLGLFKPPVEYETEEVVATVELP